MLRRLSECIERSSTADLADLLKGSKQFYIATEKMHPNRAPKRSPLPKSKKTVAQSRNWSAIVKKLRGLTTRDAGSRLMESLALSRSELEQLARKMDLPVSKHDNAERLRDKMIEASIGAVLSSRAIRGSK